MSDRSFINQLGYVGRVWAGSHLLTGMLPVKTKPLMASLKLTENCQAACVTCHYWRTRWADRITTDDAIDLINQLGGCGVKYLRFTGGEPLLRRDLFTILNRARTVGFRRISIQTNGLLLKKLHRDINDSPITRVSVSIDGLEPTNDRIRGIAGYFQLALEGFSLIKNKELQLCVTLSRDSIRELDSLTQLARDLGADFAFNVLDDHMYFTRNIELRDMWPEDGDIKALSR
jgi:MoaA/NifB/PqqE/SkfB family radical SAM enzyme